MNVLVLLILTVLPLLGQPCDGRVRAVTGNWEVNLFGDHTRPNTWGRAASSVKALHFTPSAGCRVEVLKLRGDLVAWPCSRTAKRSRLWTRIDP